MCFPRFTFPVKTCFPQSRKKNAALSEIKGSNSFTKCGISIDGTWQRRGYSSLNGCVSAISVDTGKILDIEVMTQYCHIYAKGNSQSSKHVCFNYKGSAGNMEVVGAYRIFERSNVRNVQYKEYYGDGDSKGYESVKNFYGINTLTKLECIGHVQKRVEGRLRQLKKTTKGLGGKNKLTDKLFDRIQNYYGIAIRSNVGYLQKIMSSVIAAFFHCVSGKNNSLHGQCPEESESWCRYQRAKAAGSPLKEIEQGLPNKIINQIKPTYLKLCNETLLKKYLHGARSPNNKCLCVKRVWPMRRRVNLTSVLRIGITGHAPMTGFTECSLLSNC
ncbi:uncharacterized protein TNCV_240651 [Trichonephila clavipes]|nr:uncharacterized protein TNCV_240651 [Trichonephila clavipes]